MDRNKRSLGLTLMELLIILAVVSVLVAVIVPNVVRFFGPEEPKPQVVEVEDELLVVHYSRMEVGEPYHFEYLGTSMVAVSSGGGFVDIYTLDAYERE